jgi:hypothetical protein
MDSMDLMNRGISELEVHHDGAVLVHDTGIEESAPDIGFGPRECFHLQVHIGDCFVVLSIVSACDLSQRRKLTGRRHISKHSSLTVCHIHSIFGCLHGVICTWLPSFWDALTGSMDRRKEVI